MENECKVIISHDFNNTHKDISVVNIALLTMEGTKIIGIIQGRDSTGYLDLTSVLQDNGYKIVRQD